MKHPYPLTCIIVFLWAQSLIGLVAQEDGRIETLKQYWTDSSHIVLVSNYSMEWSPPNDKIRYGKLTFNARVVANMKGSIPIGKKIRYHFGIEDPPRFLKSQFQAQVEGDLYYLFLQNEPQVSDSKDHLIAEEHWGFELDNSDFSKLLKDLNLSPSH